MDNEAFLSDLKVNAVTTAGGASQVLVLQVLII
jgi:hypothetical protein